MNPKHYYHTPIKPTSTRATCPVCHQPAYSRGGIHPQCAVIQSDPPKPRVKKQPGDSLLEPAVGIALEAGAEVVVEAVAVKPAPTDGRAVLKPVGAGWRSRR